MVTTIARRAEEPSAERGAFSPSKRRIEGSGDDAARGRHHMTRLGSDIYGWPELTRRFRQLKTAGRLDRAIFYRHGATNYNDRQLISGQHDTLLSIEGRREAEQIPATLPGHLDFVVCSTLKRAAQTMEIGVPKARLAGVAIFRDDRLNEVHLGDLQGRKKHYVPEFDAGDLDFAPPNGETYRQAARRVFSSVSDLFVRLAENGPTPQVAAVFCHAGVLRIISTLTARSDNPRDVFRSTLGNAECICVRSSELSLADYWGTLNEGQRL